MRWFIDLVFGGQPAEFESVYNLDESVSHLSSVVKPNSVMSFFALVKTWQPRGRVSKTRVSIQMVRPMFGNPWKPFFIGRFVEENGHIILRGVFTMHWAAKVFMSMWFGGIILITLTLLFSYPENSHNIKPFILAVFFCAALFLSGVAGIAWGQKRLAQTEPTRLSEIIRAALS